MLFTYLFIPSLLCMIVPSFIATFLPAFKGDIEFDVNEVEKPKSEHSAKNVVLRFRSYFVCPCI